MRVPRRLLVLGPPHLSAQCKFGCVLHLALGGTVDVYFLFPAAFDKPPPLRRHLALDPFLSFRSGRSRRFLFALSLVAPRPLGPQSVLFQKLLFHLGDSWSRVLPDLFPFLAVLSSVRDDHLADRAGRNGKLIVSGCRLPIVLSIPPDAQLSLKAPWRFPVRDIDAPEERIVSIPAGLFPSFCFEVHFIFPFDLLKIGIRHTFFPQDKDPISDCSLLSGGL